MKNLFLIIFAFPMFFFNNCSNKTMDTMHELNNQFKIKHDQTVNLKKENLSISFTEVKDSRCPKKVTCIAAGEGIVTLQIKGENINDSVELKMDGLCFKEDGSCGNEVMAGNYKIKIFSLNPYPVKKIGNKAGLIATIVVSK